MREGSRGDSPCTQSKQINSSSRECVRVRKGLSVMCVCVRVCVYIRFSRYFLRRRETHANPRYKIGCSIIIMIITAVGHHELSYDDIVNETGVGDNDRDESGKRVFARKTSKRLGPKRRNKSAAAPGRCAREDRKHDTDVRIVVCKTRTKTKQKKKKPK